MSFEQVKKTLKDGYEAAGFDVIDELPNGETLLRYPERGAFDVSLRITRDDVEEYSRLLEAKQEFRVTPAPPSMCSVEFREQSLIPLDPALPDDVVHDFKFVPPDANGITVEIDAASPVFANYFRFVPEYMKLCIDKLFLIPKPYRMDSERNPMDIRRIFSRLMTIRVYGIGAKTINEAVQKSDLLIESSLFTLACEHQVALMLASQWPTARLDYYARLKKYAGRTIRTLPLPAHGFRSDLVKLYQAGLSSPVPAYQFLAFYQVLEFFFQEVDHAEVYTRLEQLLVDRNFEANQRNLAHIVNVVAAYRGALDNDKLLAQLLHQYANSDAIREFIEAQNNPAEETVESLARRLTTIRDAIVNANHQHLPIDPDSAEIKRDVPLVRFLAETVIMAASGN